MLSDLKEQSDTKLLVYRLHSKLPYNISLRLGRPRKLPEQLLRQLSRRSSKHRKLSKQLHGGRQRQ